MFQFVVWLTLQHLGLKFMWNFKYAIWSLHAVSMKLQLRDLKFSWHFIEIWSANSECYLIFCNEFQACVKPFWCNRQRSFTKRCPFVGQRLLFKAQLRNSTLKQQVTHNKRRPPTLRRGLQTPLKFKAATTWLWESGTTNAGGFLDGRFRTHFAKLLNVVDSETRCHGIRKQTNLSGQQPQNPGET